MAKQLGSPIAWQRGVRIRNTRLWCDGPGNGTEALRFFSNSRTLAEGKIKSRVICTKASLQDRALWQGARAKMENSLPESLLPSWGRPFFWGATRLELLPAGYLPGAAQLLVEADGIRVLYAGTVGAEPARRDEARQVRACDVVVINADRIQLYPSLSSLRAAEMQLMEMVTSGANKWGEVTIIANDLFTAREVLQLLAPLGFQTRLPATWHNLLAEYARGKAEQSADPIICLASPGQKSQQKQFVVRVAATFHAGQDGADAVTHAGERIFLPFGCDATTLTRHVQESGASEIYLLGTVHADVMAHMRALFPRVVQLAPHQQMDFF